MIEKEQMFVIQRKIWNYVIGQKARIFYEYIYERIFVLINFRAI